MNTSKVFLFEFLTLAVMGLSQGLTETQSTLAHRRVTFSCCY